LVSGLLVAAYTQKADKIQDFTADRFRESRDQFSANDPPSRNNCLSAIGAHNNHIGCIAMPMGVDKLWANHGVGRQHFKLADQQFRNTGCMPLHVTV